MSNKVLVLGASGNVGRAVVDDLVASGVPVKAATRDPTKYPSTSGVDVISFSLQDARTFEPALEGTDRVFVMVPAEGMIPSAARPAPHELLFPFLKAATSNKARKLVLLSVGGISAGDEDFPHRKVELWIEESGARYVFIRPNWFMDNFHRNFLGAIQDIGGLVLPAGDARAAFIDSRDIAACISVALRSSRFDGRAVTITGPEALTHADVVKALSVASGRDIFYGPTTGEAFLEMLTQFGVPQESAQYIAHSFERLRRGLASEVTTGVMDMLGRPPRTFEQYAHDHAYAWRR